MYVTTIGYNVNDLMQLQTYIQSLSSRFASIVTGLDFATDNYQLTVFTTESFTVQDISAFESGIALYTNPEPPVARRITVVSYDRKSFNNVFYTAGYAWYENQGNILHSIIIRSDLEPYTSQDYSNENFNYSVRIYNVTNRTVVTEQTYTNTNFQDNEIQMGDIDVYDNDKYEVHIKSNLQNCIVHVANVVVKYSN